MNWTIHAAEQILSPRLGEAWQQANRDFAGAHPLLDTRFVQPLVRHFAGPAAVLAVCEGDGDLNGIALLHRRGVASWDLFLPAQAAMGSMLLRPGLAPGGYDRLFGSLMRALPGATGSLTMLKIDPAIWDIESLRQCAGAEVVEYGRTTSVDVAGGFDDFWAQRKKNVRQHVRRAIRRIEQDGVALALRICSDAESIPDAVASYGDIESRGWKQEAGSAIHRDNVQGRFYGDVLGSFAAIGGARVYQLLFDGRCVASLLTVLQGGMLVVLKTTYDRAFSHLGPGRLLDYLMLQQVFADPAIRVVENYTNASHEDRKWCTHDRGIYHIGLYRSALVKMLAGISRRVRGADVAQSAKHAES